MKKLLKLLLILLGLVCLGAGALFAYSQTYGIH